MFKAGLDRGEIKMIGATTDEEYEKNKVAGHFKFIVSPENQNVNLKVLINDFIKRIEKLSGYELYWQACIHTDTEHPHGHIVINRKDKNGRRIYFPKQMIKNTMREILLYHLPKTGGRFSPTYFYSVTKSLAPTWYSCKSIFSWLKTQEEN